VIIARLVPKIIALAIPWNILRIIREVMLCENIIRKVEIVKSKIPVENIFFLPIMSANRPKGKRNIAEDKIKLLITHPSSMAFAFRSLPMDGSARLTAEPRKGVRNAAKVATMRTDFLVVLSSVISGLMDLSFYFSSSA
jgi:hypothetical protein